MPDNLNMQMDEFVQSVKGCLGSELKSILIYGSYARGDFNASSDIDVMILVGLPEEEIKKCENTIYDNAFELELKYGKVLSPIIKNQDFFEYWSDTLPFYRNVKREGVKIA